MEGGALNINNPVVGPHWTPYSGIHSWLPCDHAEPLDCEGYHSAGFYSTVEHAAAAAPTPKSFGILLGVVIPPTLTPFKIDVYKWQCIMCTIRYDVMINGTQSGPGVH
jgi:hypothetical protein